jgi:AraC-type DNA-binding domain-containing proteins
MNTNNLFFNIFYCSEGIYEDHLKKTAGTSRHHKMLLVTGGNAKVVIGENKFFLKKGSLVYYSPALPSGVEIYVNEPLSFLTVFFNYVDVVFNDGKFYSSADEANNLPFQVVQSLIDFTSVEACFKKLVNTWQAKLPGYEFISKTLFQEILILIIYNGNNKNSNYAASLKVEKIIQYMREHIGLKISLDDLAEMGHISTFYLAKIFKEITGYPVIEYFNKIKFDQAKVMLIEGDKRVKEIAHILGFADEFYFSRSFKKVEGVSPSEYRDKNAHGI